MGSKNKEMLRQEEVIKQAIVDGHRRGVCNKDGESIAGGPGINIPKPSSMRPTAIFRNGKWEELI